MVRHRLALRAGALAAGAVLLASCGSPPAAGPAAAPRRSAGPAAPKSAPLAPGGEAVHGGSVRWPASVPDPRRTQWRDPVRVASAFVRASHTWDSMVDRSDAYARQRAALWGTQRYLALEGRSDPDAARGQAFFTSEARHRAWSLVSVSFAGRDGVPADPAREDAVEVHWTLVAHRRDGTAGHRLRGVDDVLLRREGGQWRVADATARIPS